MIALEYVQPEISIKRMRHLYDMMTQQFGAKNVSIWIDYINFEMKHGDPKKIGEIYKRALNMLDNNLKSIFMNDHNLLLIKSAAN